MTYLHNLLSPLTRRGALVLLLVCSLITFAHAEPKATPVATAVSATVEGPSTRITITGTQPMAYSVRRSGARTLVVELPGVDGSHLASKYNLTSPLIDGVTVEHAAGANGAPASSLQIALRAPAHDRSHIAGSNLVIELWPEASATAGSVGNSTDTKSTAAAAKQTPTPSRTPVETKVPAETRMKVTPATSGAVPQSAQGQQYGQPGFVGEPINLNVVNADVRDILNYITEQYGVNFVIDKSVGAVPVTVNVTDVPWNVALDSILRANRLGIEVSGNILRVATTEVLATEAATQEKIREAQLNSAPLVTEIIRLNYARAAGTLAQVAGSSGAFAGGSTSSSFSGGTSGGGDQGILPIIARRLSKRGSVEVDGRSNTLLVTDVKENIETNIRPLIAILDQPEPQVEIETRIVIAQRNFSRDLGVQLSGLALGSRGQGASFATVPGSQAAGSGGTSGQNTVGTRLDGIPVGIGLAPVPSLGANNPSTVIGLTTGLIGTAQISAMITAAEAKGQAKIVASPRVTALNNRSAQIESGQQIPVVTPQGGGAGGGTLVFTTTFVSVPLRLSFTPQITDAGTVVLRVVAESNSVNLTLTNSLGTPGIDTQRMETEVLVPDGGTTVVGGVLADNEAENQNRTPGVAGIPVLGNLFKRKATTRTTNEILFFITPRIYRPDFQGRPTSGTVSTTTRTAELPQPVPLGNPVSNTPPQGQPSTQQPTQPVFQIVQPTMPAGPEQGPPVTPAPRQ